MQPLQPIDPAVRSVPQAMWRGALERCPQCGVGHLYRAYLKVVDRCAHCGEELHHHRADDAPPYFTIFIVGHIVIGGVLWLENVFAPPPWVQAAAWLPATIALALLLLPRVKGALVGLQWALRMHGFGGTPDGVEEPLPELPRLSGGVTIIRGGKG